MVELVLFAVNILFAGYLLVRIGAMHDDAEANGRGGAGANAQRSAFER